MKILFAISDSDFVATANKAFLLALRLRRQLSAEVVTCSNEQWVCDAAKTADLPTCLLPFQSTGVTIEQRLSAIEEFIRKSSDIVMPDSDLPLWKLLALDDYAGSQLLHGTTPNSQSFPECDVIVLPIQGVDNNSAGGCGMYIWLATEAKARGIPLVGLEISPLGNKQTMVVLPMAHYCVKNSFSQKALVAQGKAQPHQVSLLTLPDLYLLQVEQREFGGSYFEHESQLDEILNMGRDRFVVLLPHHVAYLNDIRNMLKQLHCLGPSLSLIVRVDPNLTRRQYTEQEIVLESYGKELNALPHCLIDSRVGPAYLLQRTDLLLSPLATNLTGWAMEMGIPLLIHQQMGLEGWANPTTYWEPSATKIPEAIEGLKAFVRTPVATAIEKVLRK